MVLTQAAKDGETLTVLPMLDRAGVRLIGEVDLATAPVLAAALDEQVHEHGHVHLDLAELQFVDVSGAAVVVAAAAQLTTGCALVLHDPPPSLRQILVRFWPGAAGIRVSVS